MEPIYDSKRRAFYIDVGDMKPEDALAYIEKVREEYLRKKSSSKITF